MNIFCCVVQTFDWAATSFGCEKSHIYSYLNFGSGSFYTKNSLFLMQNEFVRIRLVKVTIFAIKKAEPWPEINPTKAPYILYTAKSSS